MKEILLRFTSRKFLLAVLGVLIVFYNKELQLTPEQINAITTLIISFTAAEGIADTVSRFREP